MSTEPRSPAPILPSREIVVPSIPSNALRPGGLLLAFAALLVALDPLRWLIVTWTEPAYGSDGWLVTLAVALLAARSLASPRIAPGGAGPALALVALTLALRLTGQLLGFGIIGGLALAVDVAALALAAGLHRRAVAVSPFWLAAAFVFALPLERVLQRLLGYPLQALSAEGACGILALLPEGWRGRLECDGLSIALDGAAVLVDLPCSGARGVLLQGLLFALLAAHLRPNLRATLTWGSIALFSALAANALRIAAVALGSAAGLPLLEEPWHAITGLVALVLAALPLILWAGLASGQERGLESSQVGQRVGEPVGAEPLRPTCDPQDERRRPSPPRKGGLMVGALMALAAGAIVALPEGRVDATAASIPSLPERLDGFVAQPAALPEREAAYYAQFGGGAAVATYGPMAVTIVESRAPLRHLHAPEECLRGLGFTVRYLGTTRAGGLPTAHYRATGPDGQDWHVAGSFVAEDGSAAPGIGEAIWQWLGARAEGRRSVWASIRRVTPWQLDPAARVGLEAALHASLDRAGPTPGPAATDPMTATTETPSSLERTPS
ncbi:MAG: exosortase T [Pseudomonadota bacterium]